MKKLTFRTFNLGRYDDGSRFLFNLDRLDIDPNNADDLETLQLMMDKPDVVVVPVDYDDKLNHRAVMLMLKVKENPMVEQPSCRDKSGSCRVRNSTDKYSTLELS